MTARPLERECQTAIVAAAILHGWRVHAELPAQRQSGRWATAVQGHVGWPDLFIVRDGVIVVRELKRRSGKVSVDQVAWLQALHFAGIDADILFVPDDMQAFIDNVLPRRRKP